jgi:hypothetical protein
MDGEREETKKKEELMKSKKEAEGIFSP